MIPAAYINAWATKAPWQNDSDIEQDLILSRLMVEIANHELLGPELAMRGGTCLHKLHLTEPRRYSDDLDYVRSTEGGIGKFLDALRELVTGVGLEEHSREFSPQMVHMVFDAESTDGQRRIRIKIETNTREIEPCFKRITRPYGIESAWWSGAAELQTFELDELMGTKLRALYQRSKGRDLYDLWRALVEAKPDDERIIDAFHHYIQDEVFTFHELAGNLATKLTDPEFKADLNDLVATPPAGYDFAEAADLVMERLGSRLKNAPPLDEIQGRCLADSIAGSAVGPAGLLLRRPRPLPPPPPRGPRAALPPLLPVAAGPSHPFPKRFSNPAKVLVTFRRPSCVIEVDAGTQL